MSSQSRTDALQRAAEQLDQHYGPPPPSPTLSTRAHRSLSMFSSRSSTLSDTSEPPIMVTSPLEDRTLSKQLTDVESGLKTSLNITSQAVNRLDAEVKSHSATLTTSIANQDEFFSRAIAAQTKDLTNCVKTQGENLTAALRDECNGLNTSIKAQGDTFATSIEDEVHRLGTFCNKRFNYADDSVKEVRDQLSEVQGALYSIKTDIEFLHEQIDADDDELAQVVATAFSKPIDTVDAKLATLETTASKTSSDAIDILSNLNYLVEQNDSTQKKLCATTSSLADLSTASTAVIDTLDRLGSTSTSSTSTLDARVADVESKVDSLSSKIDQNFTTLSSQLSFLTKGMTQMMERMSKSEEEEKKMYTAKDMDAMIERVSKTVKAETVAVYDAVLTTRRKVELLNGRMDALDEEMNLLGLLDEKFDGTMTLLDEKMDALAESVDGIQEQAASDVELTHQGIVNVQQKMDKLDATLQKQTEDMETAYEKKRDYIKGFAVGLLKLHEERMQKVMQVKAADVQTTVAGCEKRIHDYAQRCHAVVHAQLVALTNSSNGVADNLQSFYSASVQTGADFTAELASLKLSVHESSVPIVEAVKQISDSVADAKDKLENKIEDVHSAVDTVQGSVMSLRDDNADLVAQLQPRQDLTLVDPFLENPVHWDEDNDCHEDEDDDDDDEESDEEVDEDNEDSGSDSDSNENNNADGQDKWDDATSQRSQRSASDKSDASSDEGSKYVPGNPATEQSANLVFPTSGLLTQPRYLMAALPLYLWLLFELRDTLKHI
jgi:hypothetical protein